MGRESFSEGEGASRATMFRNRRRKIRLEETVGQRRIHMRSYGEVRRGRGEERMDHETIL